jgi:hypothetical protein
MSSRGTAHEQLLAREVYIGGAHQAFGEITLAAVRARAEELREVAGWGPTMRVAPAALAWRELTMAMETRGAKRVQELDAATLAELAPRLGVVMPDTPMMT